MKITVISLFRDSEEYIHNCLSRLDNLETMTDASFEYFFYENDSIDNTKSILEEWIKNKQGKLLSETLNFPSFSHVISSDRFQLMAHYRNKILSIAKPLKTDFTVILDSDIIFSSNIVNKYLPHFDDLSVVMVTSNTTQNIPCQMTKSNKSSYYDSLALIDTSGNQCMTWASNPFYKKKDRENWENGKPVSVSAAFAGIPMIRSSILNKVGWRSSGNLEHWQFCDQVNKHGKILAIPDILANVYISQKVIDSIPKEHIGRVMEYQQSKLND